jgi:glutaredoxin
MPLRDWLRSWWQPPPRRLDHWQVVMYTRGGCHLCEAAWQLLTDAQQRHGFSLRQVDIDTDPALVAEHGEHVPVVSVNSKVRFRGVVNPVLLRRLFEAGG